MIKIENTDVYGWETAIRGMRNPKNSWAKSDSHPCDEDEPSEKCDADKRKFCIGNNDMHLMQTLAEAGTDHGKFLRMITVSMDVTAPLYWWKEFDTYKVGTVANSCSTMHKLTENRFALSDFSHEHLNSTSEAVLIDLIRQLNYCRDAYLEYDEHPETFKMVMRCDKKDIWWQMIQLLPSSYNQKRTIVLNYAVLRNMYHARKNHKLDEWHDFCHWIESLPYAVLITGGTTDDD